MKLTVTIDTMMYRIVPIDSTGTMDDAGLARLPDGCMHIDAERCYTGMLSAVPAIPAGVVVHSGEPCNAVAIVNACADECERTMMFPGGRCESYAHHGVVNAAVALRDNAQSIIDAVTKGKI